MNSNLFIAVHKPTGRLCIVRQELLGSQVMFKEKEIRLTCEVGSFSDFELIENIEYSDINNSEKKGA